MGPIVEVDETYIGDKEKNKLSDKKSRVGLGLVGKQDVVGTVERGGRVSAEPVRNTSSVTLQKFITNHAQPGATVCTDSLKAYKGLKGYNHEVVNHGVREFVRGMAYPNGIESFWALLKRGYYGIYHYMSAKHLYRYINEFSFRHDPARVDAVKFIAMTVGRMENCRLTYRRLSNATQA